MSTLTCSRPTVKPSPARLAAMFLRDRGYTADVIRAAASDLSVIDPADAASVARILDVARTVDVRGAAYQIEPLHSPDGAAYRLTSPKGKVYDVCDHQHGAECDCPDFVCRRAGLDAAGCKHIRALVREGLIANAHVAAVTTLVVKAAPAPVEAPAAVEPLTEGQEADRAIAEDRACFLPVTEEGKRTAREISARQIRLERIAAELEALRSAPLEPVAPVDPWDVVCDPRDWPTDTDAAVWTASEAPVPAPSEADPAAVAAAFEAAWLADLTDPGSVLHAASLPARPSADARPVKVRPARRRVMNFGDEDAAIVGAI